MTCAAGHEFCFGCVRRGSRVTEPHGPASCAEVAAWAKREGDSGEDAKWLKANTKPCPGCKRPIQKNDGCSHMTCRPPGGCGHEFCWLCLGPWVEHVRAGNPYSCNRRPDKSIWNEDEAKAAQSELQQFVFYYDR